MSGVQASSLSPLRYQSLPLSASINPYCLSAVSITSDGPENGVVSKLAFNRSLSPMGGSEVFALPAAWVAGWMYACWVLFTVKRIAWFTAPAITSETFTRPGRIGKPAASPLPQPSGRSASELRSNFAPEPQLQPGFVYVLLYVS